MSEASIGGGCLCGAVRFRATLPPNWVAHCHCSMCRRAHGAGFVTWVGFPRGALRFESGEPLLTRFRSSAHATLGVERRFTPVQGADKYNSGVLARTAVDLSVWHQAQVGLEGGFLFGPTPVDGVVKRLTQEPAARRVRAAGEWNVYEVVARGPSLSLWVNGAFTSEIPIAAARGYFGLEAEGWRIEFRSLKVKPLE